MKCMSGRSLLQAGRREGLAAGWKEGGAGCSRAVAIRTQQRVSTSSAFHLSRELGLGGVSVNK